MRQAADGALRHEEARDADRLSAAVEDSVSGVRAGRAAGMTVFGYADQIAPARLVDAGAETFGHMSELESLLDSKEAESRL